MMMNQESVSEKSRLAAVKLPLAKCIELKSLIMAQIERWRQA